MQYYLRFRFRRVILHQSAKFYRNRTAHGRKNDAMSMFNIADLRHIRFCGSIMASLKSPCTIFYHHTYLRQMAAQKQQKQQYKKGKHTQAQKNNKKTIKSESEYASKA